jgi:antitoxin ParD1/3/4
MATMNVSPPDTMKAWVEGRRKGGRYSNPSDYVRDLMPKDQELSLGIAEIQSLISHGIESGAPQPFDGRTFLACMKQYSDGSI